VAGSEAVSVFIPYIEIADAIALQSSEWRSSVMKPLEGITVFELGTNVAVPSVARVLQHLGAKIIKLEPMGGDIMRTQAPVMSMTYSDEENAAFDMVAVNKNFVSFNLKDSKGLGALLKILESTDVFVASYRNKALAKLGLSYEALQEKYPRLVYAHFTGVGEDGPDKDAPGYDTTSYSARGGVLHALPQKGTPPIKPPVAFGDFQASICLACGVCAALAARERTGKGDKVMVSLHHTALYMMTAAIVSAQYGNKYPMNRMDAPNPINNCYPTRDGRWIQMCIPTYERDYQKLFKLLGLDELIGLEEYSTLNGILKHKSAHKVVAAVESKTSQLDLDDLLKLLKENDLSCEKAFNMQEIIEDQQAWDNGCLQKIAYPSGDKVFTVPPIRMASIDEAGQTQLAKSRGVGSDTVRIMKEYGYTEEEISVLEKDGSIYCGK
jgi:crotonobetainyl-CoA:carnitine CoA-transferase CaiB-like acyl-CoA transferase